MSTMEHTRMSHKLLTLERTIESLNGQLEAVRGELRQAVTPPMPQRPWKQLVWFKSGQEFMSAVCNRHVRPNIKVVPHAGA